MLQHVRTHTTIHHLLACNLHLNSTALVQFTNGSYPFTLAAGPAGTQTCVNINTLDDRVQGGPKVFNVSIGQTTSTGGVVNVETPSNTQVTIVDTTGRRGVSPHMMCVVMVVFLSFSPALLICQWQCYCGKEWQCSTSMSAEDGCFLSEHYCHLEYYSTDSYM